MVRLLSMLGDAASAVPMAALIRGALAPGESNPALSSHNPTSAACRQCIRTCPIVAMGPQPVSAMPHGETSCADALPSRRNILISSTARLLCMSWVSIPWDFGVMAAMLASAGMGAGLRNSSSQELPAGLLLVPYELLCGCNAAAWLALEERWPTGSWAAHTLKPCQSTERTTALASGKR